MKSKRIAAGGVGIPQAAKKEVQREYTTANPLHTLLDRLESVRRSGNGFVARCPAHPDRNPSLSITEAGSGAVLLKCWAGCDVDAIVAAVGLRLRDLFPPRESHGQSVMRGDRLRPTVAQVLKMVEHPASVCAIALWDVAAGRPIDPDDQATAARCAVELMDIVEACRG